MTYRMVATPANGVARKFLTCVSAILFFVLPALIIGFLIWFLFQCLISHRESIFAKQAESSISIGIISIGIISIGNMDALDSQGEMRDRRGRSQSRQMFWALSWKLRIPLYQASGSLKDPCMGKRGIASHFRALLKLAHEARGGKMTRPQRCVISEIG